MMKPTLFVLYAGMILLSSHHVQSSNTHSSVLRHLDDSGDAEEALEAPSKRDCDIDEKSDEVAFKCKTKTEDEVAETEVKDKIEFIVSTDEGIMVTVAYEQEIETNTTEIETETSYTVRFDKVIEYSKVGNTTDLAFDWETDMVVNSVSLAKFEFSDVQTDANGIISRFEATSEDGSMVFTFTISRADVGDPNISANKMKIDFELKNFQWMESDTNVALLCDIVSEQEIEIDSDEDSSDDEDEDMVDDEPTSTTASDVRISFASAVDTIGVTPFGEYTWDETAIVRAAPVVDGEDTSNATATSRQADTTISVVATSPADPMNTSIAFSFVGDAAKSAADIFWDPEAGVSYLSADTSDSSYPTKMGVIASILFSTTFLLLNVM